MKTACVYHSIDLDGWMSAAIVRLWFEQRYKNDAIILQAPSGDDKVGYRISPLETLGNRHYLTMFGYNYGQPVPDLSGFEQVIMCDISFPKEEMYNIANRGSIRFIWCDHHVSAINDNAENTENTILGMRGIRDVLFAACELTWKYFFPDEVIPEIVRLLGRYDCFGHKGTSEETKVLEFQYGARQIIGSHEQAYEWLSNCMIESKNKHDEFAPCEYRIWESGKGIYGYLCTEAKQSYKNGFKLTLFGEDLNVFQFICINKERFNPINFGIDYHADGYDGAACFHRRSDGKWAFSLYNDNGLVDCSIIAKSLGGGGHKGASGFIVDDEGLKKLLS